jgi:hypothetical protein
MVKLAVTLMAALAMTLDYKPCTRPTSVVALVRVAR